ncbi:Precorrin-2 C(20)-methyltransferase [Candidatus Entotheonellaceae bacterium PAL068K]
MSDTPLGTFYGVGVGPGDPELLTCKAVRILNQVDRILYPAEARGGPSFCQRITLPLGLPEAKCQVVYLGMSRHRSDNLRTYETAVDDIVSELRQGKSVAWMTQGDPLFYSTFIHLYEEMRRRFPEVRIEVVPAVTSPSAAAALAGVPVARLDEKVAVLPAMYGLEGLTARLDEFATVFLMKVSSVFDQLLDALRATPYPVQAVYVERVGTPEERLVTDLETLRSQKLPYFSLVILRKGTPQDETADTQDTA